MDCNQYKNEIDLLLNQILQTEEERRLFDEIYEVIEFKKGELFMKEGAPWYNFGFLIKGSLYSYFYNDQGEKSVTGFYYFPQQYMVVDYESFVEETKISANYECFEPTVILKFNGKKLNELFPIIPSLYRTRLEVAENRYFASLNMIKLLRTTNASEKVQELYNQSPEIFRIFPYAYIASYLGMHRNTYRRAIKNLKT